MDRDHFARRLAATIATLSAGALLTAASGAAPVSAAAARAQAPVSTKAGNVSIVDALGADAPSFDDTRGDFDVAEAAVLAVLNAEPDSDLAVLTRGRTRATYFLPTDLAFMNLVEDLTGEEPTDEADAFDQLPDVLDISMLEDHLLMGLLADEVVLGRGKLRAVDGRRIRVAQNQDLRVRVRDGNVLLKDHRNLAAITRFGINAGNKQVAHGIDRVLVPVGR